ncbi:hypothetical protein HNP46_000445 [Pseudomonas nitritireducens]|uniref:DUF6957 domain-containing protein n=1 Tax=Pseudomonas nitroreducens TaxID=46680 RepID=A0A7W7NZI4_PSENT|nr:hypothetical protein [Pseudomonas nitritireducens]MBB4861634.1 hypothetical protein [Pseudomonas nitritireducens]
MTAPTGKTGGLIHRLIEKCFRLKHCDIRIEGTSDNHHGDWMAEEWRPGKRVIVVKFWRVWEPKVKLPTRIYLAWKKRHPIKVWSHDVVSDSHGKLNPGEWVISSGVIEARCFTGHALIGGFFDVVLVDTEEAVIQLQGLGYRLPQDEPTWPMRESWRKQQKWFMRMKSYEEARNANHKNLEEGAAQ